MGWKSGLVNNVLYFSYYLKILGSFCAEDYAHLAVYQ